MTPPRPPQQYRTFAHSLMIAIILIIVPVIGFISAVDYAAINQELTRESEHLQHITELAITEEIATIDAGLKLYDTTLNTRMNTAFSRFLECYSESGGDPANIDLEALKEEFGGGMDLYIINEEGIVEYTTFEPDLGLDFAQWPDFYENLTVIREGDEFRADRVVKNLPTGELRKYAYMPTPDHRYVLELGLISDEFVDERLALKYTEGYGELQSINPYLESVEIYDMLGDKIEHREQTDDAVRTLITGTIFPSRTDHEVVDAANHTITRYLFVDLRDPDYPSDMSLVVELAYNTAAIDERIAAVMFKHILVALAAILLGCGMAYGAARYMTRPIAGIVDDVDEIASGNLDHAIHTTGVRELVRLEHAITTMVGSLRFTIEKLRSSEEEVRQYSENLEKKVAVRTEELDASNRQANLYLDIMTHDIKNANTIALGYSQLLGDEVEGVAAEYAKKLMGAVRTGSTILDNVATMRAIQEHEPVLMPVDLDQVIRRQIRSFPDLHINYEGTEVYVYADELLSRIFSNLIDNGRKYAGKGSRIAVRVEEAGADHVRVSVEDDGPGIPLAMKKRIFERYVQDDSRRGQGLGLSIVRMLADRYGGAVWADDRVPGMQEEGAAFHVVLKKAPSL
ncbi:MAG: ATP-binding protein [Methanomicrobiaceae archaeon]|nr:ATP-binding protein [Methanomicrobiaceae archaeon]